jgi:hypothetical protein
MNGQNSYPTYFPSQKIPTSKKTKQWYKDCLDSGEDLALSQQSEEHHKMDVYWNMYNDIIDPKEVENVFNPMKLKDAVFPATYKNIPLSVPKIDLLEGEKINRKFEFCVRSKNLDAYSSDQTDLSDMLMQILIEELQSKDYTEQQLQKRLKEFSKYAKYEWKDIHELTATRILQYIWRKEDLQDKFRLGFIDALVRGRTIYRIDIEGEEPKIVKRNPRNIYTVRMGESNRIEDSDIILDIAYESIGAVIDEFYDYLTPGDIQAIEEGYARVHGSNNKKSVLNYENELPQIYSNLDFGDGEGFVNLSELNNNNNYRYGLPYDDEGNVRIVRIRWKGRRKIGHLTYFDENGDEKDTYVNETYKPNVTNGESVKWMWINEAYEATKIADDIYVKMQPREIQMRHFGNKSKCFLGYVGLDFGKSMMSRLEPYQYLWNIYFYKLEMVLAKYKGPIYELDISKVPDDWDMDMWMYYADILGWAVVDPFNEGKKGSATGKLAGNFNTTGKVLDPNIGNYIQQIVLMLQYIEKMAGDISGVNSQRLGQVDNRETVGGVERAVTQSSHITEKWYFAFDELQKRVMLAALDTAKYAWRKYKNKKINFVLDDMGRQFIEFDGSDIASTEFDLFVTNSRKDLEIRQAMKQLSQAAVQNGASLSLIVDVLRSDSITETARRIEREEDDRITRQEQQQQAMIESQERIAQMEMQKTQAENDLKKYEIDTKANVELTKAQMQHGDSSDNSDDIQKQKLELDKSKQKLNEDNIKNSIKLQDDQLKETIRHNKATETISKTSKSVNSNKK